MKAFIAAITVALFLVFVVEADKATFDKCKNDLEYKHNWTTWVLDKVPTFGSIRLSRKSFEEKLANYDRKAQKMLDSNMKQWSKMNLTAEELSTLETVSKNFLQQTKDKAIAVRTKSENGKKTEKINNTIRPDQPNQQ